MKTLRPIRVSIIEDDEMLRRTLASRIDEDPRFTCVRNYPSAEDLFREREFSHTDVFLVDLVLPGMSGIEAIARLRRRRVKGQMLVLTNFNDDGLVREAIIAGARGYILKTTPIPGLLDALQDVHTGGSPMNSAVARIIVDYVASLPKRNGIELLTSREHEVLHRLAQRKLYKEIAIELKMSVDTVRSHMKSIYSKLNVHKRFQAEQIYRRRQASKGAVR